VLAEDFLQDAQVRQWLDGVEPAWTLLTFDSLRALRQEPSASQTAIRIANDLRSNEIAGSIGCSHSMSKWILREGPVTDETIFAAVISCSRIRGPAI
jgi:hypothetical protein